MRELIIKPDPNNENLSASVEGIDHEGNVITTNVVTEKALTLYLNSQEVVTMMTIGDFPDLLAIGFLLNQNMLHDDDEITSIDYDDDINVVVVRTKQQTNYEDKMKKKIRTSGCAQGTTFGDLIDSLDHFSFEDTAKIKTSWLKELGKKINNVPSLYLSAGAIHGCVLCEENRPLVYMEDVGRHNAVDKIAGYMYQNNVDQKSKIFYTTGRLTSEMVIKTVKMGIPILVSRSGFTAWGVELAKQAGLTLIGRARGQRFIALSGYDRIVFDSDDNDFEEDAKHQRKASRNRK